MKGDMHFNLIKPEEILSPNPVRLRLILPVLAVICAVMSGVWSLLESMRADTAEQKHRSLQEEMKQVGPAHSHVVALSTNEADLVAGITQLNYCKNSRRAFGDALYLLGAHIPHEIQLTEVYAPLPPTLPDKPASAKSGKKSVCTNTCEEVTLRLCGRAGGGKPADAIDELLALLREPCFTNLIKSARVPQGALRQEDAGGSGRSGMLLFEILCQCEPRRFE